MPTTLLDLHFCDSKPFWRCLGSCLACIGHDFGQLICVDHLVSITTWKHCHRIRGLWMARDMCTCIEPSCWSKSTGQLFCMLNRGAGRASFSLTIFSPYSLKEVFVFNSVISRLIYFSSRNAVLEFWMSLVICTQTTKRLSLLVASRDEIPSLVALGKAQNMRER